ASAGVAQHACVPTGGDRPQLGRSAPRGLPTLEAGARHPKEMVTRCDESTRLEMGGEVPERARSRGQRQRRDVTGEGEAIARGLVYLSGQGQRVPAHDRVGAPPGAGRRDLHGYAPLPTLEVRGHRGPQEPCSGEPDDHEVTVLAAERCCDVELVEPDVTAGVQPAPEPLEVRP